MNTIRVPCISLYRPWADWVSLGWKTIETRTHQRFKILNGRTIGIHAGRKWDEMAIAAARSYLTADQIAETYRRRSLPFYGVVCTAEVIDEGWLLESNAPQALIECRTSRHGLKLAGIKRYIKPIEVAGGQGLFYVNLPEV